jgi:two-component system, sensor histidine kinase RegB
MDRALHDVASRGFLRLLCRLRWIAVLGQAITIWTVTGPLGIALEALPLWSGVGALAFFNVYASIRATRPGDTSTRELFVHLLVDITVLAWQVAWSGGIENPFASLFLLPIALAILALPPGWVWAVAVCVLCGFGFSVSLGSPLPHVHGVMGDAFNLHKAGMLVNFLVSAGVMLVFFARLATLWRDRQRELAALRERFARNEGIIALATHAASVAHELNTPLATLTLMLDDLGDNSAHGLPREELRTMRTLVDQCRDRVRALAAPAQEHDALVNLEEVIDRWQLVRPSVALERFGSIGDAHVDASVGHLIQALLNNAADASQQAGNNKISLRLEWAGDILTGEIRDYGAGFDAAMPVLPGKLFRTNKPGGLGIGLALSHVTVERLGGELSMQAPADGPGVRVLFRLPMVVA